MQTINPIQSCEKLNQQLISRTSKTVSGGGSRASFDPCTIRIIRVEKNIYDIAKKKIMVY
jgi:hypothetical protein